MSIFTGIQTLAANSTAVNVVLHLALALGVIKMTTLALSFGNMLLQTLVLPPVNYRKYGAQAGHWAVVTGASDGLGKEYALQLAKRGFNVLLVSRTQAKLEALAQDIKTQYGVQARFLALDFSADSEENYAAIAQAVADLPVTVLINNVGQSHSIPVPFLETEDSELRNIITINTTATLKTTQIIAPRIVATARSSRCRGLILTMGSFGGLLPTPYLATYSGSKAFLQAWSAALAGELAAQNVDVQLVISYLVTSAMSKIKRASASIPTSRAFVASALNNVCRRGGAQDRYATSTPFPAHALMHWGIENTVGVYSKLANSLNLSMHKSIRARALKKQARLAKKE